MTKTCIHPKKKIAQNYEYDWLIITGCHTPELKLLKVTPAFAQHLDWY